MYRGKLIYRGSKLVNWDPASQMVLADDEFEHETLQGNFYYVKYPLTEPVMYLNEKIAFVTIATTRPETMLGDTAVAVHPEDPKSDVLLSKMIRLPIVGRLIPIIADDAVVRPDPISDDDKAGFSTGFLKVTPAHDPTDWEIGERHNLEVINVFGPDGTISHNYRWKDWEEINNPDVESLFGLDWFDARKKSLTGCAAMNCSKAWLTTNRKSDN